MTPATVAALAAGDLVFNDGPVRRYRFAPMAGTSEYREDAGCEVMRVRSCRAPISDHVRVRFPGGFERDVAGRDLVAL